MDILIGLLICIVYFVIGFVIAGICKANEINDVIMFALLWPISLAAYLFLVLISFAFTVGDKLIDELAKLIFREKK